MDNLPFALRCKPDASPDTWPASPPLFAHDVAPGGCEDLLVRLCPRSLRPPIRPGKVGTVGFSSESQGAGSPPSKHCPYCDLVRQMKLFGAFQQFHCCMFLVQNLFRDRGSHRRITSPA